MNTDMNYKNALETYDQTIKNCMEHEYPAWVSLIQFHLTFGTRPNEKVVEEWIVQVYDEVKRREDAKK